MSSPGRSRKLSIGLASVLAMLQSGAAVGAQSDVDWQFAVSSGLTLEPIVGLVDVPELVGNGCGPEVPVTIELYGTPSTAKAPIGMIQFEVTGRQPQGGACSSARVVVRRVGARTAEAMPMEESGYEVPAVIAYEHVGQWFRIALPRGSAWMMSANPQNFRSYPEMLQQDRLNHMTPGWDGRLWNRPGAGFARAVSAKAKGLVTGQQDAADWLQHRSVDVDVLAIRRIGKELWIQVRVTDGHCGGVDEPRTLDTGWIPAHRPTGKPSVWFYSRGC
jgi:hypothetical protein